MKVYYHRVGTPQSEDVLVFKDLSKPDWMWSVYVSHCGQYLFLETRKDCDDICLLSYAELSDPAVAALDKEIAFTPVITEWIGGFDYLHNEGSRVYLKTNHLAPRSKVIALDLTKPEQANWEEVLPQHDKDVLQYADCLNGMLLANYL